MFWMFRIQRGREKFRRVETPVGSGYVLLQCLHELPDGRMVTTQHAVEPVMPPLCNIGGSRQPHKGGIMLIQ